MHEIEKITSRANGRLTNARKVRDGKIADRIFIEGRRLVEEALCSELVIDEAFVSDEFRFRDLIGKVEKRTNMLAEVPVRLFDSISDTAQSQGIILIARRPRPSLFEFANGIGSAKLPIVIFLHEINNPLNLGAIMRTAEAAGVAGIIVSPNSADAFSPKSSRAALGANFRLPVWENAGFEDVLQWAHERDLTSTAADISSERSYLQLDWTVERLLVFGSEAHGLGVEQLEKVSQKIRIPVENEVESLNLAVSAGVILFEAKRQIASAR